MDPYAPTAAAYDLLVQSYRSEQVAVLESLLERFRPDAGPVLDIGAGSGLNAALVLDRLPGAGVLAIEPSPAMRSLLLAKVAARPEWTARVTVRPEPFGEAPLPAVAGGAILSGVLGHFDPEGRGRLLDELAQRLVPGAPAVLDLQQPEHPVRVDAFTFTDVRVGDLRYRGSGEAWPLGGERMRWRMTYQTLDGDRVVHEASAEHVYHHLTSEGLRAEAGDRGLTMRPTGWSTWWTLEVGGEG